METLLNILFDYQRFSPNPLLSELIADTQSRYSRKARGMELTEDEAGLVAAAGVPDVMGKPERQKNVLHPLSED